MSVRRSTESSQHPQLAFQSCYRSVLKAVDSRYDIRGYVLAELVRLCLDNRARIPLIHRPHYDQYVSPEALAFLEHATARLLFGPAGRFSSREYHYLVSIDPPPL
ncbi:hypothetical protein OSW16_08920 [Pseudomonas putida]|uniref:hypothetical protein n=1 Tax=Pseudomonas putida TaxID=303 RepID=UPI00226F2194|nr:hypothetical protein [Pseudomonas putida]WAB99744.1 hypothetical protein OSW16_08920 [Pseudomonas putida]